jgi:hypothetical protein
MFDPDRFVAECRAALAEDPVRRRTLREVVARAVSDPRPWCAPSASRAALRCSACMSGQT